MSMPLELLSQSFNRPVGGAVLVICLRGSVDDGSVSTFRDTLAHVLRDGWTGVVLDCAPLTFISSAGMSALLELHDLYAERDTRLELASVIPSVYQLLDSLGMTSMFAFHGDVTAALGTHGIQLAPPPQAPTAPSASAAPAPAPAGVSAQNNFAAAPAPAPAPPAKQPAGARKHTPPPQARAPGKAAPQPSVKFPVKITCTNCKTKLRIGDAGKYKCGKCGIYYSVTPEARVKAYNTIKPRVIEMRFPTEEGFCESIRRTAVALVQSPGMRFTEDDRDAIEHGVDEAASLVVSKSAADGRARFLQVYLVADEREFILAIRITENLISDLNEDTDPDIRMKLAMIDIHMSNIELINLPSRGQILKLVKVASAATADVS